jgi:glycogen debranching enzyme
MGFQRLNQNHGHRWQILQDGATSILHADASLADGDGRVETIGLQGLAWDALTAGAGLLEQEIPAEAGIWRDLAVRLRDETLARFWIPDEQYFLTGFDRDPATGHPRPITALTAIPVELLETGFFDDLAATDRERYVEGIVAMASGPEFLTRAGIRSRALRHADLLDYPDYHGVFTCWGVTNSVYAAGLRRQGLEAAADALVTRHLRMLAGTGALHEFMYVDSAGDVRWPLVDSDDTHVSDVVYGTNMPEIDQAWTLSFALREMLDQREIPLHFPDSDTVRTQMHPARLDQAEARRREAAFLMRVAG